MSRLLLTTVIAAVTAGTAAAQSTSSPPTSTAPTAPSKPPAMPPGTAPYLNFLRAWFEAADLDHDGYLDKAELAKAFRGPKAKPPADPTPPLTEATSPGESADGTPAAAPAPAGKRKPRTRDAQFLLVVDEDKDGRVSRAEYDKWAPGYAVYAKQVDDLNRQIAKQVAAQNQAIYRQQQAQLKQMLANERYAAMHSHHHR